MQATDLLRGQRYGRVLRAYQIFYVTISTPPQAPGSILPKKFGSVKRSAFKKPTKQVGCNNSLTHKKKVVIMKAREENTFRNNIVAANLFPHKILKIAARLAKAAIKVAVGIILWAGYFIGSVVTAIIGGVIQFAIGGIIILLSVVVFFGFILWLFTL